MVKEIQHTVMCSYDTEDINSPGSDQGYRMYGVNIMLTKLKTILLKGNIPSGEGRNVRKNIIEENRKFAKIWSKVQLIFWGFCIVMSFFDVAYTRCRGAYIMAVVLCLTALIFAEYIARKVPDLILFSAFLVDAAILGAGLWAARIQLQHDSLTVVMFLAVVLVPVFFVLPPGFNIGLLLTYDILAVFVLQGDIKPQFYSSAISFLFISSSIGIVIGIYVNKTRVERFVFAEVIAKQKVQEKARVMFEQTTDALAGAIDAKDTYTNGHSRRVAKYSLEIARGAGKSEDECEKVYFAALLHDVGKIGVPIEILQKKSRLTDEEFEQIKQHPVKGGDILSVIKESPWLSIGARYHHERYDGKGYPEGLKGDEIPEIARIISVADAYDAMTSIRSYRDPIPQDKVREQIVKGSGTQFDPVYARLMVHMIDVDTEYQMKERAKADESDNNGILTTGAYREAVSAGIHISSSMTTIRMSISSDDEATGIAPIPSLILFDALDGKVHTDEKEIKDCLYLEYGEIWFDGRTVTGGARKMKSKVENTGADDIKHNGEYKIEAVRIDDHALIRIAGNAQTAEIIVALPDSSRFMYIGLTGEHCRISNLRSVKAEETCPDDYIPRIAEKISYIKDAPTGDMPNIQIDGYRKAHSAGVPVKDGLTLTFHVKCLPIARLVYHCPFIIIYASDDGKVNGKNARDLMFTRFDGECWEHDASCTAVIDVKQTEAFGNWDAWMKYNQAGYDTEVRFTVEDNKITVITENAGVSIRNTAVLSDMSQPIYAAITGDQVAVTNIRVH